MTPDEDRPAYERDQPVTYTIRIKGRLGQRRMEWFDGLTVTLGEDGDTYLTGQFVDQAALYGLLKKVRDLGVPLISVIAEDNQHTGDT